MGSTTDVVREDMTSESISAATKTVIQVLGLKNQANPPLLNCVTAEVCPHCTLRAILFQTYQTTID